MTIRDAQRLFERLERQVDDAVEHGFERVLDRGLALARRQTSGRRSLAELRRLDHPYARRHGTPLLDPAIVNVQSGALLSRWYKTGQYVAPVRVPAVGASRTLGSRSRDLRGAIVNDAPVTQHLEGTRVMFRRPVAEAVEKKLDVDAEAIIARAVTRVLSRYAT